MHQPHVLISGGGIAGLAAARALGAAGARVTLVEVSEEWRPAGAGIVLAANAMTVLDHLGVGGAVRSAGRLLPAADLLDASGRTLVRLGDEATLVAVHRGDLHAALLAGLDAEVRLGTTLEHLRPRGERVTVGLSDGTTGAFDVVVGADGIGSATRRLLLGDDAPQVTDRGMVVWRLVTDGIRMDRAVEQWGRGLRVGVIPLPGDRVYSFLVASDVEQPASLTERFAGFAGPAGAVLARLDPATPVLEHRIAELDRVDYGRGRVVLMGDAAHAMTPNLGQGAAQALEDVPALVAALHRSDIAGAVTTLRVARVERIKRRSAVMGRVGQTHHPLAAGLRNLALRATPPKLAERQIRAVSAHDPLAAAS